MRSFKNGVAVVKPQGFLDGENIRNVITPTDLKVYKEKKITALEINLKHVVSLNLNAVRFLNDIFKGLYKDNVDCFFVSPNEGILEIIQKLDDRFFNIIESDDLAKLFYSDSVGEKEIFIHSDNVENKNLILFCLVKRGYSPIVLSSKRELDDKKKVHKEALFIEKTVLSKATNRVISITKDNMVFFYLDGFLDNHFSEYFDVEYFRRSLLIGFRVFVFDATNVKGINIHSVRYLAKLAVESAEYGALLSFVSLNATHINESILVDMEDAGYIFFSNMEEFHASPEVKESLEVLTETLKKKQKAITKNEIEILPYFINSTVETVELMTGVKSTKEKPGIKSLEVNYKERDFIASSVGFYGDMEGMLVLVFAKNLTEKISKILLGESTSDEDALQDIISEFANIIVGNVKSNISKHSTKIDLTLPKVFTNMDQLFGLVKEKKGVEVKFDFDGEPFYFFLTK